MKVINLEDGRPAIPQALARLSAELSSARQRHAQFVKIVHGYGSSGVGGDLRIAIQAALRQMADGGEIHACIYGENWRNSDAHAWELLKRFPALKQDRDLGGHNKGITIVVL